MNNKTAGIIIAIVGIAIGLFGIFSIQGYLDDMRLLALFAIITRDIAQSAILTLIIGIMIFTVPTYFWILMYIGFGLCFFGALLCALD
ncbi:MAG: hypothetical protein ACTSO9_00855 [Candidatus Helarchaeota archaeon]